MKCAPACFGSSRDRRPVRLLRPVDVLALVLEQVAQVAERVGVLRVGRDRRPEGLLRPVDVLALVLSRVPRLQSALACFGSSRDRRPVGLLRAVDVLALVLEQDAQVAERVGVLRVDADRRPVRRLRAVDIRFSMIQRVSKQVMVTRLRAVLGKRLPDEDDRLRVPPPPKPRIHGPLRCHHQPHSLVERCRRPARQRRAALRARVVHAELTQPLQARLVVHVPARQLQTLAVGERVEADRALHTVGARHGLRPSQALRLRRLALLGAGRVQLAGLVARHPVLGPVG